MVRSQIQIEMLYKLLGILRVEMNLAHVLGQVNGGESSI